MRLALLHPATDGSPGEVRLAHDAGEVVAWWLDAPLIGAGAPIDALARRPDAPGVLIAWSGGLGDSLFDRSARTWMAGRAALDEACAAITPTLERTGRRLLLRTHCRHALSDAPACAAFLQAHADGPVGLAFDPASMFEASMLAGVEEHLDRLFGALAARSEALIVADIAPPASDDPDALPVLAAPGAGALDPARLGRLARSLAGPDALVIGTGPDAPALASILAGS